MACYHIVLFRLKLHGAQKDVNINIIEINLSKCRTKEYNRGIKDDISLKLCNLMYAIDINNGK